MQDLAATPYDQIDLATLDPQDRISPNFRAYELNKSATASRLGLDNAFPGNAELHAAIHLARQVLQRIRDQYGAFSPNSVFRSQATERALKNKPSGWISTSQHSRGQACDVEISGIGTLALAEWAAANLPEYDQIICENHDPRLGPNSGWVHISLRPPGQGENRHQLLSYIFDPGSKRYVYVAGLRGQVA